MSSRHEQIELQMALDFALEATWQAGRSTLGLFQAGTAVERKADNTVADLEDKMEKVGWIEKTCIITR